MGKYKIFVDGSAGTTGLRIADRLAQCSDITVLPISDADRKNLHARAAIINESDLSFLCLPEHTGKRRRVAGGSLLGGAAQRGGVTAGEHPQQRSAVR